MIYWDDFIVSNPFRFDLDFAFGSKMPLLLVFVMLTIMTDYYDYYYRHVTIVSIPVSLLLKPYIHSDIFPSDLRCEFEHQLFQQTLLTALEDGDFGECGEMNADSDLSPQV